MTRTLRAFVMMTLALVIWASAFFLADRSAARGSVLWSSGVQQGGNHSASKAYTPPAGSPERKAIMDALRGDQKVIFKVYYLKVHGDWAWVDATPLDDKSRPVAEGGPSLMHKENGAWKVMDLSVVPQDPDQPLEAEDTPPEFVKKLRSIFPGLPPDIFPHRAPAK
jgi:hypothetical protein